VELKKAAALHKIVLLGLVLVLSVVSMIVFAGCGGTKLQEIAKNSISELHLNYFSGKTQNFEVAMWSGLREEPYAADGVKGDLVEFCVLSIVPALGFDAQAVEYTAEINKQTHSGVFERSPFDRSFASDLKITINDGDEIFVYLILNGETEIAKLDCVSAGFVIKNTQALDIAIQHFAEEDDVLNKFRKGLEGQCKIITTDKNLGIYFWYVCFFNAQNERVAVVIDPKSGEIVADM